MDSPIHRFRCEFSELGQLLDDFHLNFRAYVLNSDRELGEIRVREFSQRVDFARRNFIVLFDPHADSPLVVTRPVDLLIASDDDLCQKDH